MCDMCPKTKIQILKYIHLSHATKKNTKEQLYVGLQEQQRTVYLTIILFSLTGHSQPRIPIRDLPNACKMSQQIYFL